MIACRVRGGRAGLRLIALAVAGLAAMPASADPRAVSVERQELAAPQAESVGLLAPEQSGLSADLWQGIPAEVVRALLPRVTGGGDSPAWRNLARRMLLIAAPAPKPSGAGGELPSLAELRVARVMALGFVEDALALADSTPSSLAGAGVQKARAEARLLNGKLDAVCPNPAGFDGVDAAKVQVLCHLVSGNTFGGGLGLDLLREQKPADASFIAAAEVLAGLPMGKGGLGPVRDPSPLLLAAIQAAKLPLPSEVIASARPATLRSIALMSDAPLDQRLVAAERAEAMGLVTPEELGKLLVSVPFQAEELAAPLANLNSMAGPRALAFLLKATDAADPALRVPLVVKALELGSARGRFPTTARALLPQLSRLLPQPDQQNVAPLIARALLVAGRPDAAMAWLDLAGHDNGVVALWPLARAWDVGDGDSSAWMKNADPRRTTLVTALLAGLGQKVSDAQWPALLDAPRMASGPGPGVALLMQASARDKQMGAAVLAALMVFAESDKADPALMSQALSTLMAVGLEKDARRLAVDAMLAAGL